MKVYFGKFDKNKQDQIMERFYAGGPEGNSWYGGIQPGDIVFPISGQTVLGIWKVREYAKKQNLINPKDDRVVLFDSVKEFNPAVPVRNFIKSPYFDLNLSLLNKISKSTRGYGFFELDVTPLFPVDVTQVEFTAHRDLFVILANQPRRTAKPGDLFVVIGDTEGARIARFEECQRSAEFTAYRPLKDLYESRNLPNERYSLRELLDFAAKDEAPNKEKYLESVLSDLSQRGQFSADNPVQLYDNLLVGRKRTPAQGGGSKEPLLEGDDPNEEPVALDDYEGYAELLDFNPNLILYGPPGTGKTYATKKIIEAYEMRKHGEYVSFDRVMEDGRVQFITFHQSYSYEEFVEGIRPEFEGSDGDSGQSATLRYRIADGILKRMVQSASTERIKRDSRGAGTRWINPNSRVWKMSLGPRSDDTLYKRCKRESIIAGHWLDQDFTDMAYEDIYDALEADRPEGPQPTQDANSADALVNQMSQGDIVLIYDSPSTIRDVGVITSGYEFRVDEDYPHTRAVNWIKEFGEPFNIVDMNGGKRLTLKTVYELPRVQMSDIEKMLSFDDPGRTDSSPSTARPYYLIIDEINRGNISKIFGELITLIEKDKRGTTPVTLPYSQKSFIMPKNLYLIGTMNTSDRSIAILDTALRRRFAFIEIEPDSTIFSKSHEVINNTIELPLLLDAINERIVTHLDRDHRLGHAYFMDLFTLDELYKAWYYKVLPLLMEYFYSDVKMVQDIVGRVFVRDNGSFNFLSKQPNGSNASEFENALIRIYKDGSNE